MLSHLLLPALCLLGSVTAYPHDEHSAELTRRHNAHAIRSLEGCSHNLLHNRELHGSEEFLNSHAKRRGYERNIDATDLDRREVAEDEKSIKCALTPQSILGPYWLDKIPIIRTDIREEEPGIPMVIEMKFIDVDDCRPVRNAYIDIWQANATGAYSGFEAQGTEGATWLRGVSPTNSNGVVRFISIFPGHYPGRTVHTHIMARVGGEVKNGYYQGGQTPYIGQVYYNQCLIDQITRLQPYVQNTNQLLTNLEDRFFLEVQSKDYDGIAKTSLLGNRLEDGIFARVVVGIHIGK